MERLDGQVAIVTGGARGSGLGIATVLRAEGANVVQMSDEDLDGDVLQYLDADRRFHVELDSALGNARLAELVDRCAG
jgi:NAD(P)-dependent dehydrogenase (short-subunit alcohol dehydrogenase family)